MSRDDDWMIARTFNTPATVFGFNRKVAIPGTLKVHGMMRGKFCEFGTMKGMMMMMMDS